MTVKAGLISFSFCDVAKKVDDLFNRIFYETSFFRSIQEKMVEKQDEMLKNKACNPCPNDVTQQFPYKHGNGNNPNICSKYSQSDSENIANTR